MGLSVSEGESGSCILKLSQVPILEDAVKYILDESRWAKSISEQEAIFPLLY